MGEHADEAEAQAIEEMADRDHERVEREIEERLRGKPGARHESPFSDVGPHGESLDEGNEY